MTEYCGQEVKNLSDDDLVLAIRSAADIDKNRVDRLAQAGERHKFIFTNHPPTENPVFTNLVNELNSEFQKRKLKCI